MKQPCSLHLIFKFAILVSLLISFYIFINTMCFKSREHQSVFSMWQFPMLLAIFLEVLYETN